MMKRTGFSLIELMVVVAIIAILVAVAIPAYGRYIDDAAKSEANTNLVDIAAKQRAFFSAWNTFITAKDGFNPSEAPDRTRKDVQMASFAKSEWKKLGFNPGGPTYWLYRTDRRVAPTGREDFDVCAVRRLRGSTEFAYLRSTNERTILYSNTQPEACK